MTSDLCRCLKLDAEPLISSSSILCYAIPPGSQEVYFLLGKECIYPTELEPLPRPKAMWCDFSGGAERDENAEETAAREFFEESLGAVRIDGAHTPSELAEQLRNGQYAYKVTMCSNYGAEPDIPRRYHVTFLKQIAWDPHIPRDFERTLGKLTAIQQRSARITNLIEQFSEEHLPLLGIPIRCRNEGEICTLTPLSLLHTKCDSLQWTAWFTAQREDGTLETVVFSGDMDAQGEKYCTYLQEMTDLQRYYDGLSPDVQQHSALYQNDWQVWSVLSQYLEKTALMFWNAGRLKSILSNGIQFRKEYFRPSFMSTMAVVLDVLEDSAPSALTNCYTVQCVPVADSQ